MGRRYNHLRVRANARGHTPNHIQTFAYYTWVSVVVCSLHLFGALVVHLHIVPIFCSPVLFGKLFTARKNGSDGGHVLRRTSIQEPFSFLSRTDLSSQCISRTTTWWLSTASAVSHFERIRRQKKIGKSTTSWQQLCSVDVLNCYIYYVYVSCYIYTN